jgi:ATP-dependent Clp protease adaptor protein ClpS
VCAALVVTCRGSAELVRRRIGAVALERALDSALAARASTGGYRDGPREIPIAGELARLLDVRRGSFVERMVGHVPPMALFEDILAERLLSPILDAARINVDEIDVLYNEAVALARERGDRIVRVEHYLLAALDRDLLGRPAQIVYGDPARLRSRIENALREVVAIRNLVTRDALVDGLVRYANVVGRADAKLEVSMVHTLRADVGILLREDTFELIYALAHGTRPEPLLETTGDVLVVLHDDDYTTMEFVTKTLVDHFDLEVEKARAVMLSVHRDGEHALGPLAYEAAAARVTAAFTAAVRAQMPLRISLRPAEPRS